KGEGETQQHNRHYSHNESLVTINGIVLVSPRTDHAKPMFSTPQLYWVGPDGQENCLPLEAGEILIGRKGDADVVLNNQHVSSDRASIFGLFFRLKFQTWKRFRASSTFSINGKPSSRLKRRFKKFWNRRLKSAARNEDSFSCATIRILAMPPAWMAKATPCRSRTSKPVILLSTMSSRTLPRYSWWKVSITDIESKPVLSR